MADETLNEHDGWGGPRVEGPGTRIGLYTLVRRLGEGGFGDVFEAEQEQPVKRRVALKILKLGMDTREVIARFDVERQALAMMEHPHIARVLDAGATGSGRPYFVMELVDGEPITQFCDIQQLTIKARLQLFEQVCKAVQHAHTKGVIHRDLKPGNVLTSLHEGQPYAKVIDFGIAKATSGRLTDRSLATHIDQVMGTPLYMSPEQARGSADIDTRTDIYSLGVILYELLTGSTPVERTALMSASLADTQKLICETEPPYPSARLMKMATRMTGEVNFRTIDPGKVAKTVRGELDWIVMKALEKEPARRYETANALAMDVRRYLDGEAVLAAPPSALYRARKFVRRNKGAVAAGSLVALSLLAGIAAFAWQARIARARANELQQVSNFQAAMLGQIDPTQAGKLLSDDVQQRYAAALLKAGVPDAERAQQIAAFGAQWQRVNATDSAINLVDRTILKPAVVAIDRQFKNQPLVDASLRHALAESYDSLGQYDQAYPLMQQALATRRRELGDEHHDTLESMEEMGGLLNSMDKSDEAEGLFRKTLATRRRKLGDDHPDTIKSLADLGMALDYQGKASQAEPIVREALAKRRRILGSDNKDTLISISSLASVLVDEGKADQAEPLYLEALGTLRRVLGNDNPLTVNAINDLGADYMTEGKPAKAEPYFREAWESHRRLQGEVHPDTLQSLSNLGGVLMIEGKLAEAEPVLRDAIDKCSRVLGADNATTLLAMATLGKVLVDEGKFQDAERLLTPSVAPARTVLGETAPPQFALYMLSLGKARTGLRAYPAAESALLEAHGYFDKASGSRGGTLPVLCLHALIDLYAAWDKAEPGKGYGAKSIEWKKKLDEVGAAGRK